jgi:AAA domain, putative AbiEii toxin, Type IV TA system/AAA domain
MLTSLDITAFRALQGVKLDGLRQVNLITGGNNAGKTSVLEAVFWLHCFHNPALFMNLRGLRNADFPIESPLEDLQPGFRSDRSVSVSGSFNPPIAGASSIKIVTTPHRSADIEWSTDKTNGSHGREPLWISELENVIELDGKPATTRLRFGPDRFRQFPMPAPLIGPKAIYVTFGPFGDADFERFSEVRRIGKHRKLIEILSSIDERIVDADLLQLGNVPMLFLTDGLVGRPTPLHSFGEGVARLLRIAISMLWVGEGGIVLIDEFENGIHYTRLPSIWQRVFELSRNSGVQMFATSHSDECVRAARNAAKSFIEPPLRVYRMDRHDSAVSAVRYEDDELDAAFELGLPIR